MKLENRTRLLAGIVATGALVIAGIGVASSADATPPPSPTAAIAVASPSNAAVYELNVNGQVVTLTDGETVVYQMQRINAPALPSQASPNVTYPGTAGTLTVTASAGVYHYSLAMDIAVTNFIGAFSITDLSSGLSGGVVPELVWAGSVPTSKLHGHRYSGTLAGIAYFLGVPVAKTVPNATLYTYP
jgi:hypothetical protein